MLKMPFSVVTSLSRRIHEGVTSPRECLNRLLRKERMVTTPIEWIASQPWSNGIVGIFGASYMGVTSLQATVDAPAALHARLAYITAGDYYRTWGYVGGAFELGFNVRWVLDQAWPNSPRPNHGIDSKVADAVQDEMDLYRKDPIAFFKTNLDPLKIAPASASLIPHLKDWLAHPSYDEYWSRNRCRLRQPTESMFPS